MALGRRERVMDLAAVGIGALAAAVFVLLAGLASYWLAQREPRQGLSDSKEYPEIYPQ
jgi:hypothetical protein